LNKLIESHAFFELVDVDIHGMVTYADFVDNSEDALLTNTPVLNDLGI